MNWILGSKNDNLVYWKPNPSGVKNNKGFHAFTDQEPGLRFFKGKGCCWNGLCPWILSSTHSTGRPMLVLGSTWVNKILVFKTRHGAKYCQNRLFQGVFIFIFNGTKLFPAVQHSHRAHYFLMNLTIRWLILHTWRLWAGCCWLSNYINPLLLIFLEARRWR